MDTGVQCTKEMVDLLMRIKKHLKVHHHYSLNLSDDNVMTGLLELASVKDDLLQGMIQYLMALAGREWSDRYLSAATGKGSSPSTLRAFTSRLKERMLADTGMNKASLHEEAPPVGLAETATRAVRYYRGQPVYS